MGVCSRAARWRGSGRTSGAVARWLGGEYCVGIASDDLELNVPIGQAGVGELDSDDGISMGEQVGSLGAVVVGLGSGNWEGAEGRRRIVHQGHEVYEGKYVSVP